MSNLNLLRFNEARVRLRRSRTQMFRDIEAGTLPPTIKIGEKAVAFVEHEIEAVLRARIAGKSQAEIKALVRDLVAARKQAA